MGGGGDKRLVGKKREELGRYVESKGGWRGERGEGGEEGEEGEEEEKMIPGEEEVC